MPSIKFTKKERKKRRTPIKDISKWIDSFTLKFCRQYEIYHWHDEVAAECLYKWWKASQNDNITKDGRTVAEKMQQDPPYAKRVIFNAAIQWEQRWRKDNHHSDYCDSQTALAHVSPDPDIKFTFDDLDLSMLSDIECLILELHYGFGRGIGDEISLFLIARQLKRSETWVRQRHTRALRVLEQSPLK